MPTNNVTAIHNPYKKTFIMIDINNISFAYAGQKEKVFDHFSL